MPTKVLAAGPVAKPVDASDHATRRQTLTTASYSAPLLLMTLLPVTDGRIHFSKLGMSSTLCTNLHVNYFPLSLPAQGASV